MTISFSYAGNPVFENGEGSGPLGEDEFVDAKKGAQSPRERAQRFGPRSWPVRGTNGAAGRSSPTTLRVSAAMVLERHSLTRHALLVAPLALSFPSWRTAVLLSGDAQSTTRKRKTYSAS